jgi:serine/threonine-protein kinase
MWRASLRPAATEITPAWPAGAGRWYHARDVANAPRTDDPLLGRIVADKYRIEAVVGSGASGTVYRASHVVLGRPVALKVLNPALLTNENARARFRREARAASKLDHPNSVQVLDYGSEADGLTYLTMELLDGRELYRVIYEDWPLGSERIVRIMSQVLAVLAAAHEVGIVHRDLKPENIMLVTRPGDDGQPVEVVKVTDFGIAKTFTGPISEESLNVTRDGAVHGTPEYMAPEQARGEELDGRADLYACGVILYEMLSGTLPFHGDGAFDVILKHLTEPVTPPSARRGDVDRRLEPVAMRALSKRREDRYPDARAMRAALLEALTLPAPSTPAEPKPAAPPSAPTLVAGAAPPPPQPTATIEPVPLVRRAPSPPPSGEASTNEPERAGFHRERPRAVVVLGTVAAASVLAVAAAWMLARPAPRATTPLVDAAATPTLAAMRTLASPAHAAAPLDAAAPDVHASPVPALDRADAPRPPGSP